MHFQVRVPRISGDVVALCSVVDAMAMAKATAFGATEFHQTAYDGLVANISASLLAEAKKGCLQVCDQNGFAASADELIERVKRTGTYIVASQYVVEPNWQALKKAHPERETAPGYWNWSGIDLGESEFDDVASELRCLCATLKHLNDWGVSEGNSFSLDPNAPPWIDERGVMGLSAKPPGGSDANPFSKVDVGEAAGQVNQGEAAQQLTGGEPFLNPKQKNSRDAVRKWVHWQAWALVKKDDVAATLVDRIWRIADSFKYGSERSKEGEPMTRATILKELPPRITGGRGKNRGRSKAGWPDFGNGGKAIA